ncbi:MAG: serine/threonine protein kinase [Acidobacteria bacterium]|nr:serine/threonine protein kinase [Acidobacteriota bacterium]
MITPTTEQGDEPRAFLQQRVALFGKVMSIINALGGLVYVAVFPREYLLEPWFALYLINTALVVAMWLTCRTGVRSARFCRGIEAVAVVGSALSGAVTSRFVLPFALPQALGGVVTPADPAYDRVVGLVQNHSSLGLLIGLAILLVVRAALVPSGTLRTVALTMSAGVIGGTIMTVGAIPFEGPEPIRAHTPLDAAAGTAATFVVWWTMVTIVCVAITRIIYGLRRELRRARQLGQYTLEEKLGEGGMGTVYRARHAMMRRPTAVKLLQPDKAGEAHLARFEREVQLTAQLTHPNTITIFDYGRTPDGVFYYAMELLDGATLADVVRLDGPQPPGRVLKVLAEVASALEEAHGIDFIHRDIKPANIILCRQGGKPDVAKLVDFGMVKDLTGRNGVELTSIESIAGTPLYISPEALTSPDKVDARADLYALGAVGYFMLTGAPVFTGRTLPEVCGHHLHTPPEPPADRLGHPVPPDLEQLVLSCLAKEASDRPQSASELLARLRSCTSWGEWSDDVARAWWRENGRKLHDLRQAETGSAHSMSIAVDLEGRRRPPGDLVQSDYTLTKP